MRAVDLIRHKRDGGTLDEEAIEFLVDGVTRGTIPDYQTAALLMAICLRGMNETETLALTNAMISSGVRMTYPGVAGRAVDKHSTGGVGDKTSIVLAPIAAASGAHVPMMSGRGLGHTGGTLDKLESIPGFRTALTLEELRKAIETIGCALIGQTDQIAPADRKLYALRDVTATVESIPLICASIMSKKIAEGIGGLVLDVKSGTGAFMKTVDESRQLASSLVAIGKAAGVQTRALVTRMDEPLGRAVGNANEVVECLEVLKGRGPKEVEDLSIALAARMLVVAGVAPALPEAESASRKALASGSALEKFRQIVANQGGDPRVIDDYSRLPATPDRAEVEAPSGGFLAALNAEMIGRAAVALGAGRSRLDDPIDHGVGIEVHRRVGTPLRAGDPVVTIHHRGGRGLNEALALARQAITIGAAPSPAAALVVEELS